MLRQVCLLFLFVVFQTQAQTEAIVQNLCQCEPLAYSEVTTDNKIFFITKETPEADLENELHFKVLQKQDQDWYLKSEIPLDLSGITLSDKDLKTGYKDYFDTAYSATDSTEMITGNIAGNDYSIAVLALGKMGTAYGGIHEFLFIYKAVDNNDVPLLYYYQGIEYQREFTLRNSKRISNPQDPFYQFSKKFVAKNLKPKEPTYGIDEQEVFNWRDKNKMLFKNLKEKQTSRIHFVAHDSTVFYERFKSKFMSQEMENERFKAYSGFKSPAFVYDKEKQKSLLVFIPEGWPNGGAWGVRSYNAIELKDNLLYLDSDDTLLIIDLEKQNIKQQKAKVTKT